MTHSMARNSPEKSLRSKSERLEARISRQNKDEIIQEHEIMVLSRKDQEVFVEALFNPPEPSEKLRLAAQRYKKNMGVVIAINR
ncbi:DUF1778 domain-containing protein [Dolichospermum planctonicum CS-1226]|uniref:DUF1778 domain-containing protein n=1 Tax=Dolichospermum planctonicum CS-1226 TaxID=3021751 RepID=A0ABT5AKZ7_9CYAN|nr:DUF1778 domain-containing protein [Dolichospermum planctonicum]MDB9537352.1 DUF1778 domain-containing protein [Dolichospermum planctonicum CS-1226]